MKSFAFAALLALSASAFAGPYEDCFFPEPAEAEAPAPAEAPADEPADDGAGCAWGSGSFE